MCYSIFSLQSQASQIPTPDQSKQAYNDDSAVIPSPPVPDSSTYPVDAGYGDSTPTSGYGSYSTTNTNSPMSEGAGSPDMDAIPVEVFENKPYFEGSRHYSPHYSSGHSPPHYGSEQPSPHFGGGQASPHYGSAGTPNSYVQSPPANYQSQQNGYYNIREALCTQQQQQQPFQQQQQFSQPLSPKGLIPTATATSMIPCFAITTHRLARQSTVKKVWATPYSSRRSAECAEIRPQAITSECKAARLARASSEGVSEPTLTMPAVGAEGVPLRSTPGTGVSIAAYRNALPTACGKKVNILT